MGARSVVVRVDGAVEACLGAVLVSGALGPGDFPAPVGRVLLAAAGAGLLCLAAVLLRARATPKLLRTLAAGNALTAALGLAWWSAADGFSGAGSVVTLSTSAALALLAAVQLLTQRERRPLE